MADYPSLQALQSTPSAAGIPIKEYTQYKETRMLNPLMRVRNAREMQEERDAAMRRQQNADPEAEANQLPTFNLPKRAIAGHIRQVWWRHKIYRQAIDERLLACLRARRAVYGPAEMQALQASGGLNIVFTDLTETKCRGGSAWIRDVMNPPGQRAWGLEPTPLPDLPEPIEQAIRQQAMQQARQVMAQQAAEGQNVMDMAQFTLLVNDIRADVRDQVEKEFRERAQAQSLRMEQRIQDDMDQGGFSEAMDGFIEDFVTYPAAIMKGPIFERRRELRWPKNFNAQDASGAFEPMVVEVTRPTWARVSPFDFYPSPNMSSTQRGDLIERIRLTREELYAYKGMSGYNDEEIDKALIVYHDGKLENWLWTEQERIRLEQLTLYQWLSPNGIIDGLVYWGSIPGWMCMEWGVPEDQIDDPVREYDVNAVLIGEYVIYCQVNPDPLKRRPYFAASYDTIPGALWGRSIPELCAPSQKMCNAAACAMADNLSIASGPMAWVHVDRFADGFSDTQLGPWKVFQLKSDPTQGVNPGMGFFQPDANINQLQAFYNEWEQKADDATGIPRYVYGNQNISGAGATLGGLQLLMESAGKGLRRAITTIDERVMKPMLEMAYYYQMLYGDDVTAKGDCAIVARGAAAILIKAAAVQNRQQALALIAGNPMIFQMVGPPMVIRLIRSIFQMLEIDDSEMPTVQEVKKMLAAQAAQPPEPSDAEKQVMGQMALAEQDNQTKLRIAGVDAAVKLATKGVAPGPVERLLENMPQAGTGVQTVQRASGGPGKPGDRRVSGGA